VDVRGDVTLLQREIQRLNTELDNLRKGFTDPVVQECKRLRQQLARCGAVWVGGRGRWVGGMMPCFGYFAS